MAHVFISYSHKDKEYAHKLADELKSWGIEAWIDDRIDYGTQWPRVIQENLDACPGFIVIMSPNSYDSDWVQNEVSYAQANKKAIFPILLSGKAWVSFAAKQYSDVRNGGIPPNKYFETIQKQLRPYMVQSRSELQIPNKPRLSADQQLNEQIVDYIMDSVKNSLDNRWEIGIFEVGYSVPKKNPPKWVTTQEYFLSSKIINANLLQRYDEKAYQDYSSNEERIAQKERTNEEKFNSQMNQLTASRLRTDYFLQTLQDKNRLRGRLNLQLFMRSQFEFSEEDVRKFVKKLIDIHKAHNIPVSKIKIKVIE